MSAIATPAHPPFDTDRRPGGARLTRVELRKMLDTRAGFWLPVAVAGITVLTVLITLLTGHVSQHTFRHVLANALEPQALLLPVIGVLLVTSEWSQRTTLTTFTLVPQRSRVFGAKLAASVVVALAALGFSVAVSALAVAIGSDAVIHTWSLGAAVIPQAFVYVAAAMVMGAAFGAAVLVSAPAIVTYFVLPTAWGALVDNIHGLRHVATWLDPSQSLAPLAGHTLSPTEWTHALATLAMWMLVPLLIGWWRLMRRDAG